MKYNAVLECQFSSVSATLPCTLAEAKEWCKIELDITEEDALITELITAARIMCEGFLNISLVSKTVTAVLNNSLGGIELPYGPVTSFTSLINVDDDTLVVDEDYELRGLDFKTVHWTTEEYLKATYVAGYTSVTIPKHFKTAILQQVAHLYEHRGDIKPDTGVWPMVKLTLKPYRRVW